MHQTRSCTPTGCAAENQCIDDPCTSWADQTCGGNDCLSSQMYQSRDCPYHCELESQCDDRDLDSPTPLVDPTCGNGDIVFDFSWTTPGVFTCPVEPIDYFWQVDGSPWSSPQNETSVSAGPYVHGDHTFYVKAKDASERESVAGSVPFSVDAIGPETPVPTYTPTCGLATGTTVTFSWDPVTDDGCSSGTIEYAYNVDEGIDGPWGVWQSQTSIDWIAETGEHTFYVKAKDGKQNESEVGFVTIGVDCTDGPVVTFFDTHCGQWVNKARPEWEWESTATCSPLQPGGSGKPSYQIWLERKENGTYNSIDYQEKNLGDESYAPDFDVEEGWYHLIITVYDICDVFRTYTSEDTLVDLTAPSVTLSCSQGSSPTELTHACLDNICSQENYALWNWTASDSGPYSSGLRSYNTYYWYTNFAGRGYTEDDFWGPAKIPDITEPTTPTHWLKITAYDACGNSETAPGEQVAELKIDTAAPLTAVTEPYGFITLSSSVPPPQNGCYDKEALSALSEFYGTAKDSACAGLVDVDVSLTRLRDDVCLDEAGEDWTSFGCPIWHDTSINELDPPVNEGEVLDWTYSHGLNWAEEEDGMEAYNDECLDLGDIGAKRDCAERVFGYDICSKGRDGFGQEQGTTDSCNLFLYDDTNPVCGNQIIISDSETHGWVTTSTTDVAVDSAGFWDPNCAMATYTATIYRGGSAVWGPNTQIDTICTTNGGYPNNHYVYPSLPPPEIQDGDQLKLCFDVVDCAGNKASDNIQEDCPILEFVEKTEEGLCKTVTIFSPAWFQTQDGSVYGSGTTDKSVISDIPIDATIPYFSLGAPGDVIAGGGMEFGAGSVSEKGWRADSYSGTLYTTKRADFDFFWELFGEPYDAPELTGDTGEACEAKEVAGVSVCYNAEDLTLEPPGASQTPIRFDGKTVIFVGGDLHINREIEVKNQPGSVVVFIVKGNVNISWVLGNDDSLDDSSNIEGVFIVDEKIYSARIAANQGKTCVFDEVTGWSDPGSCEFDHNNDPDYPDNEWPGKRLVAHGIYVTYGGFELTPPYGRNLKTENKLAPAELFVYRVDFFENLPPILKEQFLSWAEIAP
jgi:hypothetical protein